MYLQTELPPSHHRDEIRQESLKLQQLQREVSKVIVGQQEAITFISLAILCKGHILLEGVPGVAKTTMINAVAKILGLVFKRIQFTPDLLPADLLGTLIYNPKTLSFETKKGPIFANIILADEINRAPAKVQSALLECMQEHQVTIGSETHELEEPFLVFATQNPLEQEGTYRLPEAQVDRFMFKIVVHYPTPSQEKQIVMQAYQSTALESLFSRADILNAQEMVHKVYIDERIIDYCIALINATRHPELYKCADIKEWIAYGASPRATLALTQAARAYALLQQRHFVIPEDIKMLLPAILRHRIGLSYQAEAEGISTDIIIKKILAAIAVP
jgi:MoxR-like ATPase